LSGSPNLLYKLESILYNFSTSPWRRRTWNPIKGADPPRGGLDKPEPGDQIHRSP